ncbi:MAG: hypothetical protein ABR537_13475 [Gemmatimonadales bacterium]
MKGLLCVGLALGALGVVAACKDSSGPGARASSVTGIAGDSQAAPTGAALTFPLSFVALGSDGQPIRGVNVSWSVTPANGAAFTPAQSVTDVNGVASTSVVLGPTAGELTIQATVPGVDPVVFHALILDPCLFATALTVGQPLNGALSSLDCNLSGNGWYYDFYALTVPTGQQSLRITMRSSAFDTYVDFFRGDSGIYSAYDDDIVLGGPADSLKNSQLDIILPAGDYLIGANSFDRFATGAYSVAATVRPAALNGCRQVWMLRGVSASDSVTASDCADSSAAPHHYDVARIIGYAGTVLTISAHSTALNPTLTLYQYNVNTDTRTLVTSNDDSSATNTNAVIVYTVTTSSIFDVIIGTSTAGETGAYTFDVSASTTLSARASRPRFTGRDFWLGRTLVPQRAKPTRL